MTVWGFIHGCLANIGEAQQLGWKVDRMDDHVRMTHANFPKHVVGFDLGPGATPRRSRDQCERCSCS